MDQCDTSDTKWFLMLSNDWIRIKPLLRLVDVKVNPKEKLGNTVSDKKPLETSKLLCYSPCKLAQRTYGGFLTYGKFALDYCEYWLTYEKSNC